MQQNEVTAKSSANPNDQLSRPRKKKKKDRHSVPRITKILIVFTLIVGSGILGLVFGYSLIGKGSIGQAFDIETYKHLYDLVFKTNS